MDKDRNIEEDSWGRVTKAVDTGGTDIDDKRGVFATADDWVDRMVASGCTDSVLAAKLPVTVGCMTGVCKVDIFWRGTSDHAGDRTDVVDTVVDVEGEHTLCIWLDSKLWVEASSSMTLTGTQ